MKKLYDHIGIILSCSCLLHCLALPIALLMMNIEIHHDGFHQVMLILTFLISGHAIYHGFTQHCKHIVLFFGGAGFICLTAALFGSEPIEVVSTVIGALFILVAHVINLKETQCCTHIPKVDNIHENC
jgi:hypothetical protein